MTGTTLTQTWVTQDDLFTLTYTFDYTTTPLTITCTISAPGDQSPIGPPKSPPVTPQSFKFPKSGQLKVSVQSPLGDPFSGSMQVVYFSIPGSNDNAGIYCDFFYGPESMHHFEGVNVTFQTSL
ncbi:MAG: hypothetical protein KDC71_24020 [Acidobacteria bacterium]|nr:hypothetical protein [Acidobacteriota bacterium]